MGAAAQYRRAWPQESDGKWCEYALWCGICHLETFAKPLPPCGGKVGKGVKGASRQFSAHLPSPLNSCPVSSTWPTFRRKDGVIQRVSNWERRRQPLVSTEVRVEIRFTLHKRRKVMLSRRALIGSTAVLASRMCSFLESRFSLLRACQKRLRLLGRLQTGFRQ